MAEMRSVQLTEGTKKKGHAATSSTFNYENRTYTLVGNQTLSVELGVANAWKSADSNVTILPER